MSNRPIKILNIVARHGTEKYPGALITLADYYEKFLPEAERKLVIVDNIYDKSYFEQLRDGAVIIGGSNTSWEFSAWDTALQKFRDELLAYDYVHLCTSAFNQLYTAYICKIDHAALEILLGRYIALGHVDTYDSPVHILGCTSQSWIRSSFIFIAPAALLCLGSLVSLSDPQEWFSGNVDQPFRKDAPLCAAYKANIVSWLTGGRAMQGAEWHSQFELCEKTLGHFQSKALAILNEHLFTIRMRGQGTAIVDPTWLYRSLVEKSPISLSHLYDLRRQLSERHPYL